MIGARVTGSSDLSDIIAYIDGEAVTIDLGGPSVRLKVVNLVRSLSIGPHEIRIQVRDKTGQLGGYRWQFTVSPGRPGRRADGPSDAGPAHPHAAPDPDPANHHYAPAHDYAPDRLALSAARSGPARSGPGNSSYPCHTVSEREPHQFSAHVG